MGQGISYAPQATIKSQVLADFITEWAEIQMLPAVVDQEYCGRTAQNNTPSEALVFH